MPIVEFVALAIFCKTELGITRCFDMQSPPQVTIELCESLVPTARERLVSLVFNNEGEADMSNSAAKCVKRIRQEP